MKMVLDWMMCSYTFKLGNFGGLNKYKEYTYYRVGQNSNFISLKIFMAYFLVQNVH